jgi:hypothetical protein
LSFIDLDVVRAFRCKGSANPADRKPLNKRSFCEAISSRADTSTEATALEMDDLRVCLPRSPSPGADSRPQGRASFRTP